MKRLVVPEEQKHKAEETMNNTPASSLNMPPPPARSPAGSSLFWAYLAFQQCQEPLPPWDYQLLATAYLTLGQQEIEDMENNQFNNFCLALLALLQKYNNFCNFCRTTTNA